MGQKNIFRLSDSCGENAYKHVSFIHRCHQLLNAVEALAGLKVGPGRQGRRPGTL